MPATFLGLLAVVALLLTATPAAAANSASSQERVDVIVVLRDDVADARAAARDVARDHDARVGHVYEHALKGFSANIPVQRRVGLEADRRVAYVNDDLPVEAFDTETVPTGVSRIDAPVAHGSATGAGVRVAVIDTGIDSDHPDLQANLDLTTDYDCINVDTDAEDDQGHGTHVAGTIAATDNTVGVIGVAPAAELVGIKVLDHRGSGSWSAVICGIDHVAGLNNDTSTTNDIHVANMSLGGSGSIDAGEDCLNTQDAMYAAICRATWSGAVFTVAAGNDSKDASQFVPAAYPEAITVSAYQDTDGTVEDAGCSGFPWTVCDEEFASFSNYGEIVDVIAPGRNINSTTYDGAYGSKSGTSMAAPHVAGVAALVLQAQPSLRADEVEAHLRDTGQCPDDKVSAGTHADGCLNQGSWKNDPDSGVEPMSHAVFATSSTAGSVGTAPAAPANLTATAGDTSVSLDWDEPEAGATYNVHRSTTSGGPYSTIASGLTTSALSDIGLTNGTEYFYVVTAVDGSGYESYPSDEASAVPQSSTQDTTAPAAPTNLTASPGDASVSLDWDDHPNTDGDLASYRVYRATTSGGYDTNSPLATGLTSSAYTDTTVTNETTYYYVVTAVDTSGNESALSNEANATPQATADTTAPAAPTNLNASPGDASVSLDWDDHSASDFASYRVYRSTTSGGYDMNSPLATGLTSSAYTDTTVTNETTYYYVVTAVDTSGNESALSNEASAMPSASTGGTDLVVAQEDYIQSGGKMNDKHLDITIRITDGTNGIDGVDVSLDLYNGGTVLRTISGTTSGGGYLTFAYRNIGPGCYWGDVISVVKTDYAWNGNELANTCG